MKKTNLQDEALGKAYRGIWVSAKLLHGMNVKNGKLCNAIHQATWAAGPKGQVRAVERGGLFVWQCKSDE